MTNSNDFTDDFKLSQNETFAELQHCNDILNMNKFINIARRTVIAGRKFQLIDTSNGVELSIHATFTTSAEVENWILDINRLRAVLGQTALD